MRRVQGGVWAGAIVAIAGVLGGCWHTQHAGRDRGLAVDVAADRADTAREMQWPTRRMEPLQELLAHTPEKVFRHRIEEGVDPVSLNADQRDAVSIPAYEVLHKGIYGSSLLRIVTEPAHPRRASVQKTFDRLEEKATGFIPNAYILSSTEFENPRKARWLKESAESTRRTDEIFFEGTKSKIRLNLEMDELRLTGGLDARVPLNECSSAKGVILHLQALAGNDYEPKVLEEMVRRGWVQIDLKTGTSIPTPVPKEDEPTIAATQARAGELSKQVFEDDERSTVLRSIRKIRSHPMYKEWAETRQRLAELEAGRFEACPGSDLRALGTQLAGMVDDLLADNAYAAEALLEYIRTQRPDLAGKPVVIMGFSAGALAGPTIAARLGDRVKAMVLVGGAADLFAVSQSSKFSKNGRGSGGVYLRCNGKTVDAATVRAIDEAYLQATMLDPYAVGPRLQRLPILQVHATMDTWVPAKLGDLLYERLGKPERLSIWGGHEMLFYFMPSQAKRVADWVEKQALETR